MGTQFVLLSDFIHIISIFTILYHLTFRDSPHDLHETHFFLNNTGSLHYTTNAIFPHPSFIPLPRLQSSDTWPRIRAGSSVVEILKPGRIVWDGSLNNYTTPSDFDRWSWANQVGSYQWYIKGSGPTSRYLNLDPSYKNPAQTNEQRGLKLTIDSTATWNSQMMRTELIPQTSANLGQGTLFYHFSVKRINANAPDASLEHQVMFFESHFTELKYGLGSSPSNLGWYVGGQQRWSTPFTADTWFNFAYDINFSAKTVGLWASTGASPLVKVFDNVAASTFTDSHDFHVGVLRIVNRNPPEDWYFSGVYIEEGPITTTIGDGVTTPPIVTNPPPVSTTTVPPISTVAPPGPVQTKFGQCGGTGYTGPTTCQEGLACVAVSAPYYYQCQ